MLEVPLQDVLLPRLQVLAHSLGIDHAGLKKADLITRIQAAMTTPTTPPATPGTPATPLDETTVTVHAQVPTSPGTPEPAAQPPSPPTATAPPAPPQVPHNGNSKPNPDEQPRPGFWRRLWAALQIGERIAFIAILLSAISVFLTALTLYLNQSLLLANDNKDKKLAWQQIAVYDIIEKATNDKKQEGISFEGITSEYLKQTWQVQGIEIGKDDLQPLVLTWASPTAP